MNEDDHTIVATYGAEYRGLVHYYLLAGDVWRLNRLHWVMQTSLLKTLAAKYHSSVSKMAASTRPPSTHRTGRAPAWKSLSNAPARNHWSPPFGGIPLKRQKKAVLTDRQPPPGIIRRNELTTGSKRTMRAVRAHRPGRSPPRPQARPPQQTGAATAPVGEPHGTKRRKTLVVCATCHDSIHVGQPTATSNTE